MITVKDSLMPGAYWAHMITFRCNAGCPFCILNARGKRQKTEELSGKEILDFWNNIEVSERKSLSLIGGEPTLHRDIVEIVTNLEHYNITITTNCTGPFYNDAKFYKKLKPHSSSRLRINTTFHPHHISPKDYVDRITLFRKEGYLVDQTSYVNRPDINKFSKEIAEVRKHIKVTCPPYLGFYSKQDGFDAPFDPKNNEPNESYPDNTPSTMCGITNFPAFVDLCGQYEKREANCIHPKKSLIIGPEGNYYHCHYKLYYGIDPVCNIKDFKTVQDSAKNCRHYGFCNWCDVPRVGCRKNNSAKKIVLNKLYDKRERDRSEIKHLSDDIRTFAKENNLEYNNLKWFEYAYFLLYSGHRHRCKVLDTGSAKSSLPYYLASKGYNVTSIDLADTEFRKKQGNKFGVTVLEGDLTKHHEELKDFDMVISSSVIEHIADDKDALINMTKYLKPGGVLVLSTDFYKEHIEYPDANRKIVTDRTNHTDSRTYSIETFKTRVIDVLENEGLVRVGKTDFHNVDINKPEENCVRGMYTFGVALFRKKL